MLQVLNEYNFLTLLRMTEIVTNCIFLFLLINWLANNLQFIYLFFRTYVLRCSLYVCWGSCSTHSRCKCHSYGTMSPSWLHQHFHFYLQSITLLRVLSLILSTVLCIRFPLSTRYFQINFGLLSSIPNLRKYSLILFVEIIMELIAIWKKT